MEFLGFSFTDLSPVLNALLFVVAAGLVWFAGNRVTFMGNSIARRTGLGAAFFGLLMLALVTETPEIGTTLTAAATSNASLALNNMFGGIVFQTVVLALADFFLLSQAPLTYITPKPVLLLEGVALILLLAITLSVSFVAPFVPVLVAGAGTLLLLAVYLVTLYLSNMYEQSPRWEPREKEALEEVERSEEEAADKVEERFSDWSLRRLIVLFVGGALLILAAGALLAQTGEAIAEQTGLGSSFIGATLVAFSTSLPELATVFTAVRLGNNSMAISSIFGSNSIMLVLLFLADVVYPDGPILAEVTNALRLIIGVGIIVTGLYVAGLIERRQRVILRMGIDSVLVVIVFVVYLVMLYTLRNEGAAQSTALLGLLGR